MSEGLGAPDPSASPSSEPSAAPSAERPKLSLAEQSVLFEKFLKERLAAKQEQKKLSPEPEQPKLPERKVQAKLGSLKNEREVSKEEVESWVRTGVLKGLPYKITASGAVGAQISLSDTDIGYIKASIEPRISRGGKLVGGVQTINVHKEHRNRGLGIVLAMAFYVFSEDKGAEYVELSTEDTSGGWWANLGMGRSPIAIAGAKGNIRDRIKIRW